MALPIIDFHPDATYDTCRHAFDGLCGYTMDITYTEGTSPYAANPVELGAVNLDDGDLLFYEVDEDGARLSHSSWWIPLDAIKKVTVL